MALGRQADFVDIDDDDAVIDRIGHGELQVRVVRQVLHQFDESKMEDTGGIHQEHDEYKRAQRHAYPVVLELAE